MLKKIFLLSLLTMTMLYSAEEFSSERLLGIEVGYTTVNSTNEIGLNQSDSNVEFGLKIGAQNEDWRTTIHANFMKLQGRDYQKVMLDFDHFVWNSLYKTDSIVFKPYLGAHVGWLRYTDNFSTANSLAYGGEMGLVLNVLNEVDFDFGYRYTVTDIESVDDLSSFIFSVNYLY